MKSIQIEFFGLPGCGKTTTLQETAAFLEKEHRECYYPNMERIVQKNQGKAKKTGCWNVICYQFRILGISIKYILKCSNKTWPIWKTFLLIYRYLMHQARNYKSLTGEIIMSDNGLIQHIVTIQKRLYKSSDIMYAFLKEVLELSRPYNDNRIYVYIRTKPETACERIFQRTKKISIMEQGKEDALKKLNDEKEFFEGMKEVLSGEHQKIYELDGNGDISDSLSILKDILGEYVS